ncbi:MAG: DUF1338 domain-containing protein [Acidobacteria bacterium]|nr:DUF1338 domain-containing protein [Acidobacteriota bacterium]
MASVTGGALRTALDKLIGAARTDQLFEVLVVSPALRGDGGRRISRAVLAQALNMLLFEDLIERVPAARDYVEHCLSHGKTIMHDHGAVRTVALAGMGNLPAGEEAITRLLRPLGYALNGVYPLERLRMTGRSYAQIDFPEGIAQFFISELHPERFSAEFQAAMGRVAMTSTDPLSRSALDLLGELEATQSLELDDAVVLLPVLVSCFGRQHKEVALADYELLLAESSEAAWISTEGNAFNHVTDRVVDVDRLAAEQKTLGQPMKAAVETSQSGRVRQTAFHAARVLRTFHMPGGSVEQKEVPGSFLEFITRLPLPQEESGEKRLDLSFDSSNAQAIFKMTATAKS